MILTEFSIKFQLFHLGETNNNKNTNPENIVLSNYGVSLRYS